MLDFLFLGCLLELKVLLMLILYVLVMICVVSRLGVCVNIIVFLMMVSFVLWGVKIFLFGNVWVIVFFRGSVCEKLLIKNIVFIFVCFICFNRDLMMCIVF